MNPRRRNCKLTFHRQVDTVNPATGRRVAGAEQLVVANYPFLVEGLHARTAATLVGRVDKARYTISWSGILNLQDGDYCTYAGASFVLREILDDTGRPNKRYFTAFLAERKL